MSWRLGCGCDGLHRHRLELGFQQRRLLLLLLLLRLAIGPCLRSTICSPSVELGRISRLGVRSPVQSWRRGLCSLRAGAETSEQLENLVLGIIQGDLHFSF